MTRKNFDKMMSSGKQAQMYADHYLGFHLSGMPTYAAASGASRAAVGALAANPKDPALQADAVAKAPLVSPPLGGPNEGFFMRLAIKQPASNADISRTLISSSPLLPQKRSAHTR